LKQPLPVAAGVTVPAAAIEASAARASGPGGQNVNKVASKVLLRVDLSQVTGLDPDVRERLQSLAGARLDAEGRLLVSSQRFRDQPRNLDDAREKLRTLLLRALVRPKQRRPTRASAGARERRLERKRRDAQKKRQRRGASEDW
jgi:ribosome-associated protein